MAVTETLRALGSWGITLRDEMPDDIWKKIDYFGHIVIGPGKRPGALDDSLLGAARYVGPVTKISDASERRTVGGAGMALWLGDAEGKGDIFVEAITVSGDYDDVIRALLPPSGAITEGTFFSIPGTWPSSTFQFQTPRDVIDYVAQTIGAAWRVNGDGTLDFGLEADLFTVNPKCIVARKNYAKTVAGFDDMFLRGLAGTAETERDVEDYTTSVLLLAQGINGQFVSAEESLDPGEIPFVDLHGNPVKRARLIQESETDPANAPARAQLQLNRFKGTRDALTLSTTDYDIKGKAQVGDYIWVFDPTMDLVDINNEVMFRGQRINPIKLRLTETTWPVVNRMSVLYRTGAGEWLDLSPYVEPESGDSTLVVGGYNRSLSEGGSGTFPITLPDVNTTVPDEPTWDLPWVQSQYQSPVTGETKSEVELKWVRPLNTDGSTITDLDYYEIRYRQSATPLTSFTLDELELLSSDISDLGTVNSPIALDIEAEWQYVTAPAEVLKFRLQELTPGMTYEAQVRAVDNGKPANLGDWSLLEQWQASRDLFPPATPAAPTVAGSPMAVQIIHTLGRASGGSWNLDRDLGHLEVHGHVDPLFIPSDATLIGKMPADWSSLVAQVPAIGTFQITQTSPMHFRVIAVDVSGNKSLPSATAVATMQLIDNQYISNLSVSKLTAGTMNAQMIVGGTITTAPTTTFPRVTMSASGIAGRTTTNVEAIKWDSSTGKLHVNGQGGIEIVNGALRVFNDDDQLIVEIGNCQDGRHGVQVYTDAGVRVARMGELSSAGGEGIEVINDLGQLVRISTLAFGTQASTVTNTDNRIGAGFGDILSFGPTTTVTVGNTRRMIVGVGAWCNNAGNLAAYAGFDVAGPSGYFLAANFFRSTGVHGSGVSGDGEANAATKLFLVDGLPQAGNYTITMKYTSLSGVNLAQFSDRHLIVMPF